MSLFHQIRDPGRCGPRWLGPRLAASLSSQLPSTCYTAGTLRIQRVPYQIWSASLVLEHCDKGNAESNQSQKLCDSRVQKQRAPSSAKHAVLPGFRCILCRCLLGGRHSSKRPRAPVHWRLSRVTRWNDTASWEQQR